MEFSLFLGFDVEADADPIQQSSVICAQRFSADDEPVIFSLGVLYPKACLASRLRPKALRPGLTGHLPVVRMDYEDMRIPGGVCISAVPEGMVFRQTQIISGSLVYKSEGPGCQFVPGICRDRVKRRLQLGRERRLFRQGIVPGVVRPHGAAAIFASSKTCVCRQTQLHPSA